MNERSERLQFPLDSFWVSIPYSTGRYIGLGKFEETNESRKVTAPGNGKIISYKEKTLISEFTSKGRPLLIKLYPVVLEIGLGDVKKGEVVGSTPEPHLMIQCYLMDNTCIDPMRELYLYPHQINRRNIPNHTPRPLPKRLVK